MAETFTSTFQAVFGWLGSLFNMPLPYFFGGEQLCFMDIVVGTVGLLVSVASIRALVGHGFSVSGAPITASSKAAASTLDKRIEQLTRSDTKYLK